jgi:hypothetical protein
MAGQSVNPAIPVGREWLTALRALRRLLADRDDTQTAIGEPTYRSRPSDEA